MKILHHLRSRIMGKPLMVHPDRLDEIFCAVGYRLGLDTSDIDMSMPSIPTGNKSKNIFVTKEGIAIVQIYGTLTKRSDMINSQSGLMSYQDIETAMMDVATLPGIKGIIMDIDSPGGEVGDSFDLAATIKQIGETVPVWAVANDAFSAAYLLASAASKIFVPVTGGVGSIGVIATHVNESAADAEAGLKYTTVYAGAHKNDFNPHSELSDDAIATLQAEVERIYSMFCSVVAANRNMSVDSVVNTQAKLFFGQDAINSGLADNYGRVKDALAAMTDYFSDKQTINKIGGKRMESTEQVDFKALAKEIVELCEIAGMPHLAGQYIAEGIAAESVRSLLLEARATESANIHSNVRAGVGTEDKVAVNGSPLMAACKKLAGVEV